MLCGTPTAGMAAAFVREIANCLARDGESSA